MIVKKFNDDEEMASFMQKLINQPDLVGKMGADARQRVVRDFSVESMTDRYLQIYREENVKAK